MQTRGVTEPKFEEVAEIGQYKGKQFGVIVSQLVFDWVR